MWLTIYVAGGDVVVHGGVRVVDPVCGSGWAPRNAVAGITGGVPRLATLAIKS